MSIGRHIMEWPEPIILILDSGQRDGKYVSVNGFTMILYNVFICLRIIAFGTNFDIACTKYDLFFFIIIVEILGK